MVSIWIHILQVAFMAMICSGHKSFATKKSTEIKHTSFLHHSHYTEQMYRKQEYLAELYYQNQIKERAMIKKRRDFYRFSANYPCFYGVDALGLDDELSIKDGHKFTCGLSHINPDPIVYSFGSHRQQDFELSVLEYRPDAKIHIFEINPALLPTNQTGVERQRRDPRIQYNGYGLGLPGSVNNTKTLTEIMKANNHEYIDILKMDIEGFEELWIVREGHKFLPRIGQIAIEFHDVNQNIAMIQIMEKFGFRVFHNEINILCTICIEVSLIQRHFVAWNQAKLFFNSTYPTIL